MAALVTQGSSWSGGGWRKIDVNDLEVQKIASFCLVAWNNQTDVTHAELDHVVSAQAQVVAGLNYKVVVDAVVDGKLARREYLVWDRFGALTMSKHRDVALPPGAKPTPNKKHGGWKEVKDVTEPHVAKIISFLVQHVLAEHPADKYELHNVLDAEIQVVAGLKYRIALEFRVGDAKQEIHKFEVYDHFGDLSITREQ